MAHWHDRADDSYRRITDLIDLWKSTDDARRPLVWASLGRLIVRARGSAQTHGSEEAPPRRHELRDGPQR